ncbi:Tubulin delta chain [Acipenser ruthenus]|uniref:Tubulin delta chain n=2 Tax=Acipenser ruthenus TaxID=7906 RepID=A0A444V3L5_ACIRT|nr:tubulin delta chain-like isoform X1 [Acipenser ruthenus]XP_058857615.1 tubulin delta chain-like isoform X1 [Acipenser ruthenus]RXM95010.1 Tubulin delta chain [Acipenser ruthenus]
MSIVTVQLGQCGNQIGQELFNVISNDSHSSRGQCPKTESEAYSICSQERFFSEGQNGAASARAVLVDMEPKVISHTISTAAKSGRWKYGDQSSFCQKQGSGNNWANGFCVHGPRHEEDIMDLVRREVEKCDRLGGFFNMMSMAGGTGSGMGTYITQCLRDTYPHSFILNQVTWPYGTGEVIVQNYNSVLTLSHLYQSSDAILVHENDTVHKICAQLMNIKQISFKDVNKVIAHQLGSVLQPAYTEGASEYNRNPLGDLMKSMVCHPEYKLLGLRNIPQMSETSLAYSVFTWPGLLKHLRQMLIANAKMEEGIDWQVRPPAGGLPPAEKGTHNKQLRFNTSLANLLILRGKDVQSADTGGFMDPALYTSWLPPGVASSTWRTPMSFNRYEKSATLVSNSQFLLKPLDGIVGKAWNMFASRAYVHQYTQFGISEEDFLDSFTALEQIIASYTHL